MIAIDLPIFPGIARGSDLRGEFLLDQPMQMRCDRWVIEALDDFVEKAGDEEALCALCRNPPTAKVKQFVLVDLTGRGAVGATDVVGEDFETGH